MYLYILGLLSFFGTSGVSCAQNDETTEASDPTIKAIASHADETQGRPIPEEHDLVAEKLKSQMEESRSLERNTHLSPVNPSAPAVSLSEYLEYGMVPVEDLEAKLKNENGIAQPSSKSLGRYYTVYARSSGSSHDGGASANDSSENNEEYEFTEDEEETEDDREDDDSEEADL